MLLSVLLPLSTHEPIYVQCMISRQGHFGHSLVFTISYTNYSGLIKDCATRFGFQGHFDTHTPPALVVLCIITVSESLQKQLTPRDVGHLSNRSKFIFVMAVRGQ